VLSDSELDICDGEKVVTVVLLSIYLVCERIAAGKNDDVGHDQVRFSMAIAIAISIHEAEEFLFRCRQGELTSLLISTNDEVDRCATSHVLQKVGILGLI